MEEVKNGKRKCLNCGGELEKVQNSTQWRCLYCDSVFKESASKESPNTRNSTVVDEGKKKPLLLCKVSPNGMHKDAARTLYILGDYVGIGLCVNDYLEKISRVTADNRFVAVKNRQTELAETIRQKIKFPKFPQEKFLLYKSDGFVSKEKCGVVISDKSLYFLNNKKYYSLALKDISTLSAASYSNEWRMNHDKNCTITSINLYSPDEMALYLGLICELARQNHQEDFQIIIDGTFT